MAEDYLCLHTYHTKRLPQTRISLLFGSWQCSVILLIIVQEGYRVGPSSYLHKCSAPASWFEGITVIDIVDECVDPAIIAEDDL